jgi:hypothetical protein
MLKIGDIIKFTTLNKEYTAQIACIDEEEKWYGVYCEYGQDKIPFDDAILVETDDKINNLH